MTKRLSDRHRDQMSLHLLTLLEEDSAEYFIAEQQREILQAIRDTMIKEGD